MNVFIDTETSGMVTFDKSEKKRKFPDYKCLDSYSTCRIVSICWIITKNNEIVQQSYYVIKPDNFIISPESYKIHGISQEEANQTGSSFVDVISRFKEDIEPCDNIVAHNIQFDINVIMSELYRYGLCDIIDLLKQKHHVCTMLKGKEYMGVDRWPKLADLFKYLYNKDITNAHNAMADTMHCYKCYIKMFPSNRNTFFFGNTKVVLTNEQEKIVFEAFDKNIIVIASAGSAKTTTTLCRIQHMISQKVPEESIMLTTFTWDAANDMKKRLEDILGYKPRITVGTIDGISRQFTDNKKELKDVSEHSFAFLQHIRKNTSFFNKFKYLFVDEFQDINDHQYEIIKEFADNGVYIFGVGDPSQNIYQFRGSNAKYISELTDLFTNSIEYQLTCNFRSSPEIVSFANAIVMSNMSPVLPNTSKQPFAKSYVTQQSQNTNVLELVKDYLKIYPAHEIAILSPLNNGLFAIEELLITNNIKHNLLDGKNHVRVAKKHDHVCLTTIHKAKGLEWDVVLLVNMSDDLLPRSKDAASIEEGRRLFYVGCTRAKKVLGICYYITKNNRYITRYMNDIPSDLYKSHDVEIGLSMSQDIIPDRSLAGIINTLDGATYVSLKAKNLLPTVTNDMIHKTQLYKPYDYNA